MSRTLEQSLDSIISGGAGSRRRERAGRREGPGRRPRGGREGPGRRPAGGRPYRDSGVPSQIAKAAEGRPMLRLRNVHPDLNGMDLSDLFLNIAPVDFVKFDPRNETVAYVCFQSNFAENNTHAIHKFDGKKAMGNTLVVENATSLADRIAPVSTPGSRGPRDNGRSRGGARSKESTRPRETREPMETRESPRPKENHRVKAKANQVKEKKPRPVSKTAEELDKELSAYMSGISSQEPTGAFVAQDNGEVMD